MLYFLGFFSLNDLVGRIYQTVVLKLSRCTGLLNKIILAGKHFFLPASKKEEKYLSCISPWRGQLDTFFDEYPSKHKDKLSRSAEVGRSYFKLVSHLRSCISVEWSDSVELEKKKKTNKPNIFF